MCGLLGFAGEGFRPDPGRSLALLKRRGPDDTGEWRQETARGMVWLGHNRLAILDLTPLGHQPMLDPQTGNVIVYNGEIYNFRELRAPLEEKGCHFHSDSDAEVLLALFGAQGISMVHQLRGMFAIVIWEAAQERLWLIRDRLGIKPLYYYRGPEGLAFASECRALRDLLPSRAFKLSQAGLSSYLAWGSVSEPDTLWQDLRMLPPATYASWDGRIWKTERYWDPALKPELAVSEAEAAREVRRLVQESVCLRTISEVPLGVFLSGGIDSSIVAAVLARVSPGINTLTVVFPGFGYDESRYAEAMVRRYHFNHQIVTFSKAEVAAAILQALQCQDQPSIDGVNTWIISQAARKAGLTVALSGLGGDELFFGYDHFRQLKGWRAGRWKWVEPLVRRAPLFREDQKGRLKAIVWGKSHEAAFAWVRAFWSPEQLKMLGFFPDGADGKEIPGGDGDGSLENRLSYYELRHYLKDTLLRDTDVMSMAHGLEVRVPLIDHLLVEYVLRLPAPLKWRKHQQKYLLVKALADLLPNKVIARKKSGFTLPFEKWLAGELRGEMRGGLKELERTGLFLRGFVLRQWQEFLKGRQHWSRVWQLYVLGYHLKYSF